MYNIILEELKETIDIMIDKIFLRELVAVVVGVWVFGGFCLVSDQLIHTQTHTTEYWMHFFFLFYSI